MGLKVIGAGFGRTGTNSLQAVLEQLGFGPCNVMASVSPTVAGQLLAIKNGGTPDWDSMLAGFESAADFPWAPFYKEIMDQYPDAKVILTTRDAEAWYASAAETIYKMTSHAPPGDMRDMNHAVVWDGVFDGRFDDKDHAIQVFNDHNAAVQATVPDDRLLVFSVKDGWDPLCSFLGVEVPDKPFPHANDREAFRQKAERIKAFLASQGQAQ